MHSSINCSNVLTISDKVVNWHRKTKYDFNHVLRNTDKAY